MQRKDKKFQVLEFIHTMSPYTVGDIAGFPEEVATKLVNEGYAKIIKHNKIEMVENSDKEDKKDEEKEEKQMHPASGVRGRPKKEYVTK